MNCKCLSLLAEQNVRSVKTVALLLLSVAATLGLATRAEAETHYYRIMVKTSDIGGAGTDADVFVTVFGINGEHTFGLDKSGYDDFERGDRDSYTVSCEQDLGSFYAIKLQHDDSGSGSGWHVADVEVFYEGTNNQPNKLTPEIIINPTAFQNYLQNSRHKKFPVNRWLATDEGDGRCEVTIGKLSTEMIEKPENFARVPIGLHKVRLLTPQETGTTFTISQTIVDEVTISRSKTTGTENSTTLGLKSTTEAEHLGVKQSLELSAEVSNTVTSEVQSAIARARSVSTTIEDATTFTVPAGKVLGVEYWKYETQASGKLRVEDVEFDFTAVKHSWIEPKTRLFDAGSPELAEFKDRFKL